MKKNPFYSLQTLDGVPFLLPFGQAVASQRSGVRLNSAGVLLWDLMDEAADRDGLAALYLARAEIGPAHRAEALSDMDAFLRELESLGIASLSPAAEGPVYGELAIGPLRVRLCGPADCFSHDFDSFLAAGKASEVPDLLVTVTETAPPGYAGAECLLHNGGLAVYRDRDAFALLFPGMPGVRIAVVSSDGSKACFHIRRIDDEAGMQRLREDLFHAIRHAFLFMAQGKGFFALHSASVLYRDRVWAFSAPSGTGKSTQAALWHDALGVPVLNGDLSLLSIQENRVIFHPMPWCGTSGVCENVTAPLGGVVLLRQGPENALSEPRAHGKRLLLSNRLISPVWTEEQLRMNLGFAGEASRHIAVWRYACTKEPEAVEVLRTAIDRRLAR